MASVHKESTPLKFRTRISVSLLCAFSVIEIYISRINFSIAIVSMVQTVTEEMIHSDTKREPFCLRNIGNISDQHLQVDAINFTVEKIIRDVPPIQMTSTERGNLLSAFFYAYGLSGIIGGRLSEIYGSKTVLGAIILMDLLTNFLTPFVSHANYWLFFALRFTAGFFQGMTYPSLNFLLGQWIPPHELTRTISFVFLANNIGSTVAFLFGGYIISVLGWEYVFYISGCYSVLCLTFWIFFMFDTPETHPRISHQEKSYIIDTLRERKLKKKPDKVPWLKMLQSKPIWAVNVAHAGSMAGISLLVTQLPIYMSSIIGVNIRANGLLSSMPFIFRFVGSNVSSWLLYFIMLKCHWQLITLRRVAMFFGSVGPAVSYLLVGYVGCSEWAAIIMFTIGSLFNSFITSGYTSNSIDNTSNFAGTAMGIASTFAFLYSMTVPVIVGALTHEETISEWRRVFMVIFANYIATGLFYLIFASTDRQPWDVCKDVDENSVELKLRNPECQSWDVSKDINENAEEVELKLTNPECPSWDISKDFDENSESELELINQNYTKIVKSPLKQAV